MKYILFFLFTIQTLFAGREFFDWHPAEKLNEFVIRRSQIMTHIKCNYHPEEKAQWLQKFDQLWNEVEATKEIFKDYFTTHVNIRTNEQKKNYNKFISALTIDRNNIQVQQTNMY